MEIEFKDSQLALVETDQAHETKLPFAVIKALRNKLHVIRQAPDERTLRNWKSLHYEKQEADPNETRSIRINDKWRLYFTIDTDSKPNKITIVRVQGDH